eukprot:31405-Pelagococcus_subviridis.AAC.19
MKRFPQCESITRCVRELSLVASQRRRRRRDDATATTRVRTRRAEAHAKGGLRAREPASERREGRRAKDAARSPRRAVAAFGLPATRRGERAGERGGRSSKREEASAAMAKPAIPPARAYDALYGASPTPSAIPSLASSPPCRSGTRLKTASLTSSLSPVRVLRRADPHVYTVSGARDHYREQTRGAGATLRRVQEFDTMYSEVASHPSHTYRCARDSTRRDATRRDATRRPNFRSAVVPDLPPTPR